MATTTMILKMKLLIDTKKNRVLFAEANKDVVDFLFSLLALPVATIVKMLGKESMCGSVGNLYGSVENLDYSYVPRSCRRPQAPAAAPFCCRHPRPGRPLALFSSKIFCKMDSVAFSFVFNKYCPIMD